MSKQFEIEVKPDHLARLAKASPIHALSELIWNSLDADATNVRVDFREGQTGIEEISVSDNGQGFSIGEAEGLFQSLGGSWKAYKSQTGSGRFLHGRTGQGRFKSFSLGRDVTWTVAHKPKSKEKIELFQISGLADNLTRFSIQEVDPEGHEVGVTVTIKELHKQFRSLQTDRAVAALIPIFSLYLTNYSGVNLSIGGKRVDPSSLIQHRKSFSLDDVTYSGKTYSVELEIIEWSAGQDKEMWYCSGKGFPMEKYTKQIRGIGNFSFSAYLKSDLVEVLDKEGSLGLSDLNIELKPIVESAISQMKKHFKRRMLEEGQEQITRWKKEEVYPFSEEVKNPIEEAERQVFDIVAVNLSESLPSLNESDTKTKAFQLRMLRQAVESSPEELQTVISEVLNLPKKKLAELTELLQDVSLTGVINASKMITDRLKFLSGLEFILYDEEAKKALKERSQLHRIIAENTWLFGSEYSLAVDDQSLSEVLRKHQESLGEDKHIDRPVKRIDDTVGIVDLMMSRAIPRTRESEVEHLVVELKAPKVKIGEKEMAQIKSYAYAVMADERFASLDATWNFIVISNELNDAAIFESTQEGRPRGVIYHRKQAGIEATIRVMTWSQVLKENKYRLEFVKEKLESSIDRKEGIKHLRETYEEFTRGVIVDVEDNQNESDSADVVGAVLT